MTISFRCPQCQQLFRAQETYAGRQWNCPKCSTSFPIPQPDELPVEMVTERPVPERRRREYREEEPEEREVQVEKDIDLGWLTVRGGLRVLGVGVTIFIVAYVFFAGLVCYLILVPPAAVNPGQRDTLATLAGVVSLVFGLAFITNVILWIIGEAMCCAVPGESGGKPWVIISLICSVLMVVAIAVTLIINLGAREDPFGADAQARVTRLRLFLGVTYGLALLGFVFFMLFLRSIAAFFHRDGLALHIVIFLIVGIVLIGGHYAAYAVTFATRSGWLFNIKPELTLSTLKWLVILFLAFPLLPIGWFLYLVSATRSTIPKPRYLMSGTRITVQRPGGTRRRPRDEYDED